MVHKHVITERSIPGFSNYTINTEGGVYNWKLNKNVRGRRRPNGAIKVSLSQDGRVRDVHVHVLVMEAFFGDYAPGVRIKHLDGDRSNNHVSNLRQDLLTYDYDEPMDIHSRKGRRVLVHQTGDIFRSPRELIEVLGVDSSSVYKVLNGERSHYRGLEFKYID